MAYVGIERDHESVKHSVGEYVRDMHTNGMESFRALLKRGYTGTLHKISPKHLDRYVREFAARHNVREADTADQMAAVVAGMIGKRLMYGDLIADNGLVYAEAVSRDPARDILGIVETKRPTRKDGIAQIKSYMTATSAA